MRNSTFCTKHLWQKKKKKSFQTLVPHFAKLSFQGYHDLPLFCANTLPTAWEKLNSWEPAHPGHKSAPPLERPRWALDPSMPACWNNVVAKPRVYRAPHCGKHGLKRVWQLLKLPPPTPSHKGRTWLKVELELVADLLFPLTAFCV